MSFLPFDLEAVIRDGLEADRRKPDGLLHASTDLKDSLRHVQLRAAGAPTVPKALLENARAKSGTFWHEWLGDLLFKRSLPFMREIALAKYMPEGWSGTADWLVWHDDYEAFVLCDVKTTNERAMAFVPKEDHIWQTSLYWHALAEGMRLPVVKGVGIIYIPIDVSGGRRITPISFQVIESKPIEWPILEKEMNYRKQRVDEYIAERRNRVQPKMAPWLLDTLELEQPRIQKLFKNGDKYDLKLVPHWSTDYCPFREDLCPCSAQTTNKIGEWNATMASIEGMLWNYHPRKGYEDIQPELSPGT